MKRNLHHSPECSVSLAIAEQCVAGITGGVILYKAQEDGQEDPAVCAGAEQDEYGLAMSYVFPGESSFVKSYGVRLMSIEWRLAEPIPAV